MNEEGARSAGTTNAGTTIDRAHGAPAGARLRTKGESVMRRRHRILGLLVSIALVAVLAACAGTQTRESSGQYLDDSVVTTKVKAAIFNEGSLKSLQINVETYKGEVQLSGFVDSAASVEKAGEVARSVQGVISVKNNLIVK